MDFFDRNANWIEHKTLISKLTFSSMNYDIFTIENSIIKITIFDGEIFFRNELGKMIGKRRFSFVDQGYPEYSTDQLELATRLEKIGVLKAFYETHPYHIFKSERLLSYDKGPRFAEFDEGLFQDPELVFETDIDY